MSGPTMFPAVGMSWRRLRSDRVSQDLGLFVFGAILGLFFFVIAFFAMVPGNFQHGIGPAIPSFLCCSSCLPHWDSAR